jgi:hypothetical protein
VLSSGFTEEITRFADQTYFDPTSLCLSLLFIDKGQ